MKVLEGETKARALAQTYPDNANLKMLHEVASIDVGKQYTLVTKVKQMSRLVTAVV